MINLYAKSVELMSHCVRCNSTVLVAITYVPVEGQPLQAGVCAHCYPLLRFVERLPNRGAKA